LIGDYNKAANELVTHSKIAIRAGAALAALLSFLTICGTSFAASPFNIYYSGADKLVLNRLQLDPTTNQFDSLANADAAVYQGTLPAPGPDLDLLKARVVAGMGLVVILGKDTDPRALATLTDGRIIRTGVVDVAPGPEHSIELERIAAVINYIGPPRDPLATNIGWLSAVRIHERTLLDAHRAEVMVRTNPYDPIKPKTPILLRLHLGKGTIYVLNVWLRQGDQRARIASWLTMLSGIEGAENYDFQRWAYFNWLLYAMTRTAAGVPPVAYGDWIAAPVPDRPQVRILAAIFFTLSILFLVAFIFVRRYSMRHPEMLERFYRQRASATARPQSLGAAAAPQPESSAEPSRGDPRWEVVGFHRPLSGFFYNYLLSLFIMVPLNFAVTFYIERSFINPFLEARGAWGGVQQFMLIFFTLLNVGTDQAMVKYVAEYRLTDPPRAIMFAQFFIWFHALAGVFQITVLGLLAAAWMPHTAVAYLSWMVVLHTLIQFPGFIAIFFNLFRSLQRFDYAQLLIVLTYVLNPLVQMTCGIYMRHWGLMHPVFGEGMGVVFGFAIGGVIANLLMGLFCAIFYEKMGFNLVTIFLAHFDRSTIKKSIVYGAKLMGGQVAGAASWGIVPILILTLLPDGLELNEIFLLTFGFTFGYLETGCYIFTTLMPSISEAYSQGMVRLTRRYLDQGIRWALMVTMLMGAAFIAFSDVFIEGLLPAQFARAAAVIWLMHCWRVTDFMTRLPDQVFQGVGRTGTFTWTALLEHGSRIIFAAHFLRIYGFDGVYYAFILSSILRVIVAWPLMGFMVAWPSISLWQTIINPTISGLATYAILRSFALATWQGTGHVASAAFVVLVSLGASLPVYFFISGMLGWDGASLAEFRDAAELVPAPFGALARLAHRIAAYATAMSPLNDRFPGRLIAEAAEEASTLTALKAEMH
jgi:O-antigen/teichoic acid export membrane protein